MKGYKTILEVADELSVTRQAIQKKLTKEFRKKYIKKYQGKLYINKIGVSVLEGYNKSGKKGRDNQNETNVQQDENELLLRLQLSKKDDQIEQLTKLLDQQQKLQLDMQRKYDKLQLKLNDNMHKSDYDGYSNQNETNVAIKNNHWWEFWK